MGLLDVKSFVAGQWQSSGEGARMIENAVTGKPMAIAGNDALNTSAMLDYAKSKGSKALQKLTFNDRARLLKALALEINKHKDTLYDLSYATGATLSDSKVDIDGGIGTLFLFASKGRREMPDAQIYLDGDLEQLSRNGTFMGQHVCTPMQGVAVHINAFNFPVWGMLEKLAPAILAGVPVIVKPATSTCYLTEQTVKIMLAADILPAGALQLVSGGLGDLLSQVDCQDVIGFTGSATTALHLRSAPNILENSVRFIAEQDSLNASVLGPDVTPDMPEFALFIDEVQREMTSKAGQKCTAIRRVLVPEDRVDQVIEALSKKLSETIVGDPRTKETQMGALVSRAQKQDVLDKIAVIARDAELISGNPENFTVQGADAKVGSFLPPMLFHCANPDTATSVHDTEAFGPVSTVMGYKSVNHAVNLANRGQGSLVASVITRDGDVAQEMVLGAGPLHGRLYFNNQDSMAESTGHGSPLPHMIHGGPGRAGGSQELGGIRGVMHYMQRTAIQGSPDILTSIGRKWVPGAVEKPTLEHPFTKTFHQLNIGDTLHTQSREITLDDIEHFAEFTGDNFYAHMDDAAAARNPFFPGRVAHGYLLLSFAAGLFVEPNEGPVLANTGLDNLRFMKPVQEGAQLKVRLTVKAKTKRNDEYGEIRWHVSLTDAEDDLVAEYELLTMNAY